MKKIGWMALLLWPCLSWSDSMDEEIKVQCQKLPHLLQQGNLAYQKQHYRQALQHYQEHASWLHACQLNEDVSKIPISDSQLALAYNNVGLTHAKLGQPRWAKAWYNLLPNSRPSRFNLQSLPSIPSDAHLTGTYVRYAGQGQWNTIKVLPKGAQYQIDFSGLRMGLRAMLGGVNMGEFEVVMPRTDVKAIYQYEACVIDLDFAKHPDTVVVTQNQADCGFGMGVYAQGDYVKVETLK